jgi:hypothetical protein
MARVKCFELVKEVLDETYDEIEGTEEEKDDRIKKALGYLTDWYHRKLVGYGGPDYADPVLRFAYIFKYVTSHANLVYSFLQYEEDVLDLLKREQVTITCLGGGPGSDLLGILKLLLSRRRKEGEKTQKVLAYICDREQAWSDSWGDIGMRIPEGDGVQLNTICAPHDALDPKTWRERKSLRADLFTMVYFMSELYAHHDEAEAYFEHVLAGAQPGALLLFIDNNDASFFGWFDDLVEKHGFEVLAHEEGRQVMPPDEQMAVLERYTKKFDEKAKLQARVACRLVRKPED